MIKMHYYIIICIGEMGGSLSIKRSDLRTEIIQEFVRYIYEHPDQPTINVRQLIDGSKHISQPYNLTHLPLLFLLDEDKDGLFSLTDIFNIQSFQLQIDHSEPSKALKAYATMSLKANEKQFIPWFTNLCVQLDGSQKESQIQTIPESAVLYIYDIIQLSITRVQPMQFIENLHTYAGQMGLQQTHGIPIIVMQSFAQYILEGFNNLYNQIIQKSTQMSFIRNFIFDDFKDEFFEQLGRFAEDDEISQNEEQLNNGEQAE